jgi:hypothetical protein
MECMNTDTKNIRLRNRNKYVLVNITKQHILLYGRNLIVFYGNNCNGAYIHLLRRSAFYSNTHTHTHIYIYIYILPQ